MKRKELQLSAIEGKTYTLFGASDATKGYYQVIKLLADKILANNSDIKPVIERITRFSLNKRYLRKINLNPVPGLWISDCLNTIDAELRQFTRKTDEHLKNLPLFKSWDRRLRTSREQYHLYMLEIELTNRLYRSDFLKADKKIALLPYCLKDFSSQCKASQTDFDDQCKHCSVGCFQNHASSILKKNSIDPYIWMSGDLKRLAKNTLKKEMSLGVLGIACIPELVWGMRKCRVDKIPVVGIPLNANRCARWFGDFFPNSIDLDELEILVSK